MWSNRTAQSHLYTAKYQFCPIVRLVKSRRMRWVGHVARMGKPEGKRPLGRPRRRLEDNIKIDLQEVGWAAWTASMWLVAGTGGGLLYMR